MDKNVSSILKEIQKLQGEIKSIQDSCSHKRVTYKYGANTGDPYSFDVYWSDVFCIDCQKRMRFYSDEHSVDYRLMGVIGSVSKETAL